MPIMMNVRSSVLLPDTQPNDGWTVQPCRLCKSARVHPDPYQCGHCGGAGYFQINPDYQAPVYVQSEPTCRKCKGHNVTWTQEAWGNATLCADCGNREFTCIAD